MQRSLPMPKSRGVSSFLFMIGLFCGLIAFRPQAGANEHGEAPKEGAKEAAKEGSKGGGELPEWVNIQQRVQVSKAKVGAKEKVVQDLILAKQKEKDPQKSIEIVKSLKTEYRDLQLAVQEYEKDRNLLKYRFPEKGLKDARKYQRIEVKPLEEMENQLSMAGRIRGTMGRMKRQYGPADSSLPASSPNPRRDSIVAPAASEDESESRVTEPSHLSK